MKDCNEIDHGHRGSVLTVLVNWFDCEFLVVKGNVLNLAPLEDGSRLQFVLFFVDIQSQRRNAQP